MTRSLSFLPINLISFLFLPGIIIHELSHFLVASLLFVPVGEIEFMPEIEEGGLKLGSVSIGQTDPIRRFLIGVAPVVAGLSIILGLLYFIEVNKIGGIGILALIFYILFAVGNTMFSSKKDMEGALILLAFVSIFLIAFFIMGFRINLSWFESKFFVSFFENLKQANLLLLALIVIDLAVYSLIRIVRR